LTGELNPEILDRGIEPEILERGIEPERWENKFPQGKLIFSN
jgi:hypothetical protein